MQRIRVWGRGKTPRWGAVSAACGVCEAEAWRGGESIGWAAASKARQGRGSQLPENRGRGGGRGLRSPAGGPLGCSQQDETMS